MKIKQIISTVLLSGLVGGAMVACGGGSGGSSYTPPAAPDVSNSTKPDAFSDATGNSGAAWNIDAGEIAIPSHVSGATNGYEVIQMGESVTNLIRDAGVSNVMVNTTANGNVVLTLPPPANKSIALVPNGLSSSNSVKAAVSSMPYLFNLNQIPPTLLRFSVVTREQETLMVYAAGSTMVIAEPTNDIDVPSEIESYTSTKCTGIIRSFSETNTQGVDYLAFGTDGPANSNVCVMSGANMEETNLSAQAVAHTQGRPQEYTGGVVRSFGFPSTLNTGNNLVGYWLVGDSIYKVLGSYVNGTPTGNGFLKTTLDNVAQTTQQGATKVTFTGAPTSIRSSYTDNVGNVWVGTTDGKVYVLRNGVTQWTNVSLGLGSAPVRVSTNGTNAGATVTIGDGDNISVLNVQ